MIDHVALQVADVEKSALFYTAVLAPLGISEKMRFPTPAGATVGFGDDNGALPLWLSPALRPDDRELHIAFAAPDRAAVDAVHDAAVAAGVEVLHAPRVWPEYHPSYYGVFLRDPDGHNIEAVTHGQPG
jgi:catechol 2,3-dioxygenase-like lactoylglutathione lyase family enzyme